MMVNNEKYQSHPVFSALKLYSEFYEELSESVFGFTSIGTTSICNIDSHLFSSIAGTLQSIQKILRDGRINDAYSLLRKYYDSAIINVYTGLYLEENVKLGKLIVAQIDGWLAGKEQLPEYRVMSEYVRKSAKVAPITSCLFVDDRYKKLRARCNDHTHYNFYKNVLLNDSKVYFKGRDRIVQQFSDDLRDVLILHMSYMFFANDHYMMAPDHVDSLEMGMTPE